MKFFKGLMIATPISLGLWAVIISAIMILSGCANLTTTMKNPVSGELKACHAAGWGWFGTPAAIVMHHRCVKTLEDQGYVAAK